MLAATLWAGYTLGYRRSGLGAWQAAALVNVWSLLLLLPLLAWQGGSGLAQAPAAELGWQLLWQGLLAGVLGLWTFSRAIALLGAAQAAAFGALAPVVSALGGWAWLGDPLGAGDLLAIAAAAAGVPSARRAVRAGRIQTRQRPRRQFQAIQAGIGCPPRAESGFPGFSQTRPFEIPMQLARRAATA